MSEEEYELWFGVDLNRDDFFEPESEDVGMTRNAQDIIDDMRNIVKPRIAEMLLEANFDGRGREDKAEFETEFEMILTSAEIGLKFSRIFDNATNGDVIKALFPNVNIELRYWNDDRLRFIDTDWWNAPYKAESEEEEEEE